MSDAEDRDPRAPEAGSRLRGAVERVRRQGGASLRGLRRSLVEVGDRLKHAPAAERLGDAVEARRLVRKAADAQRRGNHNMAYRLLEPEVRARPDDPRVVTGFWRAALACERSDEAVPPMLHIIRRLAGTGELEAAAELWGELRETVASARVDPGSLVRIAPVLRDSGREDLCAAALREAVDPAGAELTPGTAARIAELARESDPATALRAAHRALAASDLHAAKRERLRSLVAELERSAADGAADTAAPAPDASGAPADAAEDARGGSGAVALAPAVDHALAAPATLFAGKKIAEAMPTRLLEDAIALLLEGGRKARVEFARIEALAVAQVGGLAAHPVVLIDLLLNWSEAGGDASLRAVRLRSDGFDARMLMPAPGDGDEAFRAFLGELLGRSRALALPDSDAVLGRNPHAFESVEDYERAVLGVSGA